MVTRRSLRALVLATLAVAVFALPARAQIGAEPIRIVFPFAAGGSGDALARLLAEHLRVSLSSPVIVENRTGAQGRLGVQAVKGAAPDGKTLLPTPVAPMSVYQHVYKSLAYDPIADFQPLSQVVTFDFALAVGPQVPAKSLRELVDWIKAAATAFLFSPAKTPPESVSAAPIPPSTARLDRSRSR
jgi:tripartite-type tricarboxylate transporter receptor subunit TctC